MTDLKTYNGRTYTLTGYTTLAQREKALAHYYDHREELLQKRKG